MSKGLNILLGITQGAEKAASNLYNINIMKTKLAQEQDIFNLTKKQKELEIKKGEYLLSPEQLATQKAKLDAETKLATAGFNLRSIQIASEQTKNEKELGTYQAGMEMVKKFLKGEIQLPQGATARMGQFAISGTKGKTSGVTDVAVLLPPGETPPAKVDDFLAQF